MSSEGETGVSAHLILSVVVYIVLRSRLKLILSQFWLLSSLNLKG